MNTTLRRTCTAFLVTFGCFLAATARADVLHGVGNIGDGGGTASPLKYPGMLVSERGINFGGPTFPYVFAQIGASSSSVLNPGNQVDQLVGQVQTGNVTLALMSIGDNDWFPVAQDIATGALSGPALTSFQNLVVGNIESAVTQVLNAGGEVVLGGFSNITDSPAAAAIYANPTFRANLEGALSAADDQLIAFAAANGIPFIDFFGLEKMVYDSGSFVVGGVNINLHTVGPDPHNFFQDSLNAGTVIRGEIANLWLQAMNEGYGTNLPLMSDLEILTLAGIGNEFVGESFAPATSFGDFVEYVPEPSGLALLGAALATLALVRARRFRRWS